MESDSNPLLPQKQLRTKIGLCSAGEMTSGVKVGGTGATFCLAAWTLGKPLHC